MVVVGDRCWRRSGLGSASWTLFAAQNAVIRRAVVNGVALLLLVVVVGNVNLSLVAAIGHKFLEA